MSSLWDSWHRDTYKHTCYYVNPALSLTFDISETKCDIALTTLSKESFRFTNAISTRNRWFAAVSSSRLIVYFGCLFTCQSFLMCRLNSVFVEATVGRSPCGEGEAQAPTPAAEPFQLSQFRTFDSLIATLFIFTYLTAMFFFGVKSNKTPSIFLYNMEIWTRRGDVPPGRPTKDN